MKASRLEQAIITLSASRLASRHDSIMSGIDPRAQLVVTVFFLLCMLSVPLQRPGMIIWFAIYPIIMAPLSLSSYEHVFCKSLYVLPLLIAVGIFNPFYDTATSFTAGSLAISRGWVSFVSIIIRGLLAVQSLIILVGVCGFNRICEALRRLGVPSALVTQLLMVYRYLAVLLQEALSMQQARKARTTGRNKPGVKMWGVLVGQLMLRTIERSRRIDMAMKARGFNGSIAVCNTWHWHMRDTVYCLVCCSAMALLRACDLSSILLNIFNG